MNRHEFIDEVNRKAPLHLRNADINFLERNKILLGSGPYYKDHVTKAIQQLGVEYEFLGKLKSPSEKEPHDKSDKAVTAISQIVVIHNHDVEQCHKIRSGLIQTGLINFEGQVYVNFSPYTRQTIEMLPADTFKGSDYAMEYIDLLVAQGEGNTKPLGRAINPVFFTKDIELTIVQQSFIYRGQRLPAIGRPSTLPSPLYKAFINVNSGSTDDIMNFMNFNKIFPFTMSYDRRQLRDFVAGIDESLQLGLVVESQDQLKDSWSHEQQKMKNFINLTKQKGLGQVVLPPAFPLCDDAVVEWRQISGYFDSDFLRTKVPEDTDLALFEFKTDMTSEDMVRVRRYYGWLEYMWSELIDDIYRKKAAIICERCGTVISRGDRGRQKSFCAKADNPGCYRARRAEDAKMRRKRSRSV